MKAPTRSYYKYELAELYELDKRTFLDRLEVCKVELIASGYDETKKKFTLIQVEIIFSRLGHPSAKKRVKK